MNAIDWSDPAPIVARHRVEWSQEIILEQALIVTKTPPPRGLVTSVRAVVIHDTTILVLSDRDGACHVVPGGRIEPGEGWLETVRREVLEETGLTIQVAHQIAVIASTHQLPRPSDYRYPYPTFHQVIYLARADDPTRLHVADEWVAHGAFVPFRDIVSLILPPIQTALVAITATELDLASRLPSIGSNERGSSSSSESR